ncbi:MAG: hypothetical protein CFE26_25945 [Verrucomicrobiales bacterium VVV1]|nr:MAG: hypothetical protein CFE26_25945 [Verrucomicrobiales bacterium VVV1]
MNPLVALIADGRLIVAGLDGSSKTHDCQFAADILRRQQQSTEKNSWMRGDEGSGNGGMFSAGTIWGKRGSVSQQESARPMIVAVEGGDRTDSMVYALWTGVVGAFLDYDFNEKYERRVFHRENFQVSHLDRSALDGRLICRVGDHQGARIALLDSDGRNSRLVTEGDSLDGAPSWIPDSADSIVYHSAGLSRTANGHVVGLGPYAIHRLNFSGHDLETLLESPDHDYLAPQMDARGVLHCIRRDYEGPGGTRPSIWTTVKDALLFPFRLFRIMVDFFQILSHLVSRKPLVTAGQQKLDGPEPVRLWIHGRMSDLEKAEKSNSPDGALAPADWVLIRREPDGRETILAKHVLTYDLGKNGDIVWSDGRNLHHLEAGTSRKILSKPLIDTVKWIEPSVHGQSPTPA